MRHAAVHPRSRSHVHQPCPSKLAHRLTHVGHLHLLLHRGAELGGAVGADRQLGARRQAAGDHCATWQRHALAHGGREQLGVRGRRARLLLRRCRGRRAAAGASIAAAAAAAAGKLGEAGHVDHHVGREVAGGLEGQVGAQQARPGGGVGDSSLLQPLAALQLDRARGRGDRTVSSARMPGGGSAPTAAGASHISSRGLHVATLHA